MSGAFTKEGDAGEDLPERPVPPGPNYVTPRGLEMLKASARALVARRERAQEEERKPIDRDLRYLEARIHGATVVPPGTGPEIRFGARVTLEDQTGQRKTFQIVGEDEARADPATMAWSAPLVHAMLGAKVGDQIRWQGHDSALEYVVIDVSYP